MAKIKNQETLDRLRRGIAAARADTSQKNQTLDRLRRGIAAARAGKYPLRLP